MPSSNRMPAAIKRLASRWAGMLTSIARELAPRHIAPYIKSKAEDKGDGKASISLSVNLGANKAQKYGSMDARAQEYGSGERVDLTRSPLSTRNKIIILPKQKRYMVFDWDKAESNPVFATKVESPGIYPYKGEGYLSFAIKELRYKAKQELGTEMAKAITGDLRLAFKHAKQR